MELGEKDEQNIDCINKVVDTIEKLKIDKLAYTTHGMFNANYWQRYNGTSFLHRMLEESIKGHRDEYDDWLWSLKRGSGHITNLLIRK